MDSRIPAVLGVLFILTACGSSPRLFRGTTIVTRDDDRHPFAPRPEPREIAEIWDAADALIMRPAARALAFDTHGESVNVNALDEVPDSSWFENRIGQRPMDEAALVAGACGATWEAPVPPWRVTSGKVNGATSGFEFEDARGRHFVFKADRDLQPEHSTAADSIVAALYHAVGYHVTCNRVVAMERDWVELDPEAHIDSGSGERPMTEADLEQVLDRLHPASDGRLRGAISEYLSGTPMGPWDYRGTWDRDLNDVVEHDERRELRGMRVLNAWVDHWDARQLNTLSMWHEDQPDGAGHVVHHVIDFGDTLGFVQGAHRSQARFGHSQWIDTQHIFEDLLTFGLLQRPWDSPERGPTWPVLGYFGVERFQPDQWRPNYWNGAFQDCTERDGGWMARIIARFGEPELRALITLGEFTDPAVDRRLLEVLLGRRERVLERYLTQVSPLTAPSIDGDRLCLEDVAVSSGFRATSDRYYTARLLNREGVLSAVLVVQREQDARVCVDLALANEAYQIVRLETGSAGRDTPQPIDVHVVTEGGRHVLAGLDRRTDGRLGDVQ